MADRRAGTEDGDPGLARERTELAWTRTAVSFLALGAAMLHTSAAAGVLVIAIGVAVWGLGELNARRAVASGATGRRPRGSALVLITAVTTGTAVLALVLALLVPGGR